MRPGRFLLLARATAARLVEPLRGHTDAIRDEAAVQAGAGLVRAGTRLLLRPHRREEVDLPAPLRIGRYAFDIVEDLTQYTGLPREQVEELIRRRLESFRSEWHSFPRVLRADTWFYLASRSYLYANAIHFHEASAVVDVLTECRPPPARVLEFGGGSGNLALALAARGYDVDFLEVSALQKDFMHFRIAKHGLADHVRIRDRWEDLGDKTYDLVTAFDVLEHVPDLKQTLDSIILRSLRSPGILAESSPFVRNVSNPMHHQDALGFDEYLRMHGLELAHDDPAIRLWRTTGQDGSTSASSATPADIR